MCLAHSLKVFFLVKMLIIALAVALKALKWAMLFDMPYEAALVAGEVDRTSGRGCLLLLWRGRRQRGQDLLHWLYHGLLQRHLEMPVIRPSSEPAPPSTPAVVASSAPAILSS